MIKIAYGREYGDATCEYLITTNCKTVGEFITEALGNVTEWGYFDIYADGSIFGNPRCEYRYGKIIGEPLPQEYLDKVIVKVHGSGGWSRSDFQFEVED